MATSSQIEKSAPANLGGMEGRLAGIWARGQGLWSTMLPRQRAWAILGTVLLAIIGGGLVWYATRTDWRTLYADLDSDDGRQVGMILTQAQIPFQVSSGGAGIEVPVAQLDKARLATASKGGMKSGRLGFEIFDKPNWVGSEFDEQVNYQRALEGELEHTVGTLSDVQSARVHLVMAHDSLFKEQERPAKASVVLTLRHRTLAEGEPESIRNLVASAVDGLTPERVVLVDAAGHMPLGPRTPEMVRLSAEQALEEKLIATLEPVTGMGNVRASVTLDYDPAASDETEETYDPDQTVTLSMQRTEQSNGAQPVASGVPGTASNAPNSQALPVYPQQNSQPQTAKSESGTYGASKTVKHVMSGAGRLRRMTAAVVVNDRLAQAASKDKTANWQPRSADEIRNLTALAQASVGFDPARGDLLTVEDLAFDQNRPAPVVPLQSRVLDEVERSPELLKYCTLLIGLLLVVFFGVRPAMAHARSGKVPVGKQRELAAGVAFPVAVALPEDSAKELDRVKTQEIFDQVTDHLKREPAQSSRLLQSWIHSE